MRFESEIFCKSCFDKYIRRIFPDSNIVWECVYVEGKSPDFYLTVDSAKYAVEVTRLFLNVDVGAKTVLPIGIIRDELSKFVIENIETTAKDGHFLRGTYWVTFSKPITNFTNVKGAIRDALLAYICTTQEVNSSPPKVVYRCGRQKCSIEKTNAEESKVGMGSLTIGRPVENLAELSQLLDDTLSKKEKLLRKIISPKILLLHDKYYLAELQAYRKCISTLPSLSSFQAVFLVEFDERVFMLYSKDSVLY